VSEIRRQQIMKMLYSLMQNDAEGLCAILMEWSDQAGDSDKLLVAVDEFLARYAGKSMERMDMSVMVGDLLALVRNNNLSMPPDQAMLLKVFVSLEGAFKKLDPNFDMMAAIQPTIQEAILQHYSPRSLGKRWLKILFQYLDLFSDLPKEVRRAMHIFKTGDLKVRVEMPQMERLQKATTLAANRLAVAAITAALIVGTSIVVASGKTLVIGEIDLYKTFGIGAVIGGILVLLSIWRGERL
jgi:ubiquinone biosynthesis protein